MERKRIFLKFLTAFLFFAAVCGLKSAVFAQQVDSLCKGDQLSVTVQRINGRGPYQWSVNSLPYQNGGRTMLFPNGTVSDGDVITVTRPRSTTVRTSTVGEYNPFHPVINGASSLVCYEPGATTVTVTYTTEPGMSNYVWSLTGNVMSTVYGGITHDRVIVTWDLTLPGGASVAVSYNDNVHGCRSDTTIESFTFEPKPVKPIIDVNGLFPYTSAYCPITPFTLSVTNYDAANDYTWSGVGLSLTPFGPTSQNDDEATFELHGQTNGYVSTFPVFVVVDSANGCKNSDTGQVRIYSEMVITKVSTSSTCPEVPLTLSATFIGGNQPYGYIWTIEKNGVETIKDTVLPAVNLTLPSARCHDVIKAIHHMVDSNTMCQSDTMSITFTVEDLIKPKFLIFPPNAIVFADENCNYNADISITGIPTVDLAEGCPTRKLEYWDTAIVTGSCIGERIIHRLWFISNDCGDTTWREQLVTIKDTIAPNIFRGMAFHMPIFVDNDCNYQLPDPTNRLNMPVATDNCVLSSEITIRVAADVVTVGGCAKDSLVTRRWVAEDPCGNVSDTLDQIFTIRDVRPPQFVNFPANITIYSDENCDYDADPDITGRPDATDNCTDAENIKITYSDNYYNYTVPIVPICPTRGITRTWRMEDV
jgi:hypothetical protein